MQMITALVQSIKEANARMEQQMGLITNLQQTVADLAIRVNDRDSDASTITSNDQRKRHIPHHASKSSMRRIHPNDAGTVGQVSIPPDPGDIHRYIEVPTLQRQEEAVIMQQNTVTADTPQRTIDTLEEDVMSQSTEQDNGTTDVNGGKDKY